MPKIAILGAGIIGLSSALAIQEHLPLAAVTIIADKFSPNTTSDVAAGFIEPYLCDQEDENRLIRWTRQTISRIEEYKSEGNQGAEEISGYWMQTSPDHPKWLEVMKNVKILNEREVRDVIKEENEYRFGIFYSTWYLEPTPYLRYSARKFQKNGGKFVKKLIANIDEVKTVDDFDLLVNCTGLSSKKLFNDPTVRPIRGQILRVFCPQIRHFFIDDTTYCLPNDNCLIIGGTKEIDKWDLKVDEKVAETILSEARRKIPSLKHSKILSHHIGLRPSRPNVRLELINDQLINIPVVHNYGHGGSGITLHWGCAIDTAKLVKNFFELKSHL